MAVVIRLKRTGRLHRPFYRIEAMDKRNARDGRCLDNLGYYDPLVQDSRAKVKLKMDRLGYWLERGARPSETISSFLRKESVKWGTPAKKSRKALLRKRRAERRKSQPKAAGASAKEK